jgi:hypothetical protein
MDQTDSDRSGAPISRRRFLAGVTAAGWLNWEAILLPDAAGRNRARAALWWHRYPIFFQGNDPEMFRRAQARMCLHGASSDPTWGPYAQRLTILEQGQTLSALRRLGARIIVWIEGFGDCMLYAVALERLPDGSFERRGDDPQAALVRRSHWNWANRAIPPGNTFRWVGLHSVINDEDYLQPAFTREKRGLPVPTYPDGRPAVGWMEGLPYPLNARLYDACGSKDLNGFLYPACEFPAEVNETDPQTGRRRGPTEGLYAAIPGKDDVPTAAGVPAGEPIYCGVLSVHKDLSAPFWREYARASIRGILQAGMDGVWCDNYSPWDNFGYPPLRRAFGDWSVHRFHQHLRTQVSAAARREMGAEAETFDLRAALKSRAAAWGAKDPSDLEDPAWRDVRWLDDPLWNAYKAFRQRSAQADLRAFYEAIHDEARRAGRPDFCIGGNDAPLYGLGWVRDGWLDMINTETTPGWHMGSGSRGIMIPPAGKMAAIYRVALEHQKGPFSAAWYYLNQRYEQYQENPALSKALMAEAFANGAFLMCDPANKQVAGTAESHAWWNRFLRRHEAQFGRRVPMADIGVLFSPDNQLALLAPGGFPDMDRQPHIFGHHGWATALIDGHLPYRSLTDWKLTAENLAPLRVFILPDAECLEEEAFRRLEAWLRKGGTLILTGSCGTRFGPSGSFRRRPRSLFHALIGGRAMEGGSSPVVRSVGAGRLHWIPEPAGMRYYLSHERRPALLPGLLKPVGGSALVAAERLPATVGLFLWRSLEEDALFCDLVNYQINADTDRVAPVESLSFRVRLPESEETGGSRRRPAIRAQTLTPDPAAAAQVVVQGRWATVRLSRLTHFTSVKIALRPGKSPI